MTTTPDSRIAHDWHLDALPGPESTALPPGVPTRAQAGHLVGQMTPELRAEMEAYWARAEPIDTSTTAGKIAVMQAHERGERVEARVRQSAMLNWYQVDAGELVWDWKCSDYRIAPPPERRTALQSARDRARRVPPTGGDADNSVRALLKQIDNSVMVEASPCDGSTKMYSFVAVTGPITPGRYRLVRDDD